MRDQIGPTIKEMRKAVGLTQEELGARIGVTKATINKYETGIVVNLKRPTIESLAAALETTPAFLMGWEEVNTTESHLSVGNIHSNNGIIGQSSAPMTVNNGGAVSLSKEETELLRIYNRLDVKGRMKLLSTAIELEEGYEG